jgi:hypothetical protein
VKQNQTQVEYTAYGTEYQVCLPINLEIWITRKDFILGTYHGLPKKLLQSYLDEFCYRFRQRYFESELFDRLLIAVVDRPLVESNG